MSIDIQRKVREEAEELQDYMRSLNSWEEEIKKKDQGLKKLAKSKSEPKNLPPIRGSSADTTTPDAESDNISQALKEKDKGNELFNQGKHKEAVECYTRGAQLDPTNPVLPANRAMANLKLQRYMEAEADCTLAITLDPRYVKAYHRRGLARQGMGAYDEAIKDFEYVLKLEPGNKQAIDEIYKTNKLKTRTPAPTPTPAPAPAAAPPSAKSPEQAKPARKCMVICEVEGEEEDEKKQEKPQPQKGQPTTPTKLPTPEPVVTPPNGKENQVQREFVAKEEPQKLEEKPPTTAPKETVVPAAPASKQKKPLTKDVLQAVSSRVTVELPTVPPKTAFEFERTYHSINGDILKLYEYMKMINPTNIPSIFKESISTDIFSSIIEVLHKCYLADGDTSTAVQILDNLPKVGRFDMMIMFMSDKEKQPLVNIFNDLDKSISGPEKAKLSSLRSKYNV
jgi:tetratricopeptide (TPR) repeat protein